MKVPIIILKLLFLGALFIVANHNLHLGIDVEREQFFGYYMSWVSNLFSQGVDVTAYVIKFEWLPNEQNIVPGSDLNFPVDS
ncbi:hypothetical protein COU62_03065 [Candidatus Pacearchaeota archaeon CG10_big_fil_rev_8_21_14_0_10_35_219]|nr:hypothetical protein [Candidatus Pacearchaeota archaeon]OIO43483.1 MAG: hypothetical protein AUJ63_00060 [Candidatus Pacearchaeota archaeon CG1_02_35_32]PIO07605.1 MAG: hypothetical protein COU62_03065 [Candidatus Pacearchaeota archaeon CG10_big_fil_rev_8_21_14_0_10_35_219]PIY81839.1 MAG: hypothetical protein COY79_00545 [Candidatus Pacearchaeota archaeon CG_4_10_14_0_8_um_filter_35_169]PIZ80705.1 MAG: hypothetical protein COY00_00490 [Candidatus Pacearchaeota archaeon CG_4_10_14_0_2_um_filt